MNKTVRVSRKFNLGDAMFAISLASLIVLSSIYGNFGPLLAPVPGAWTYGLEAILLVASAGLFLERTLAASAFTIAVCAAAWALVRSDSIFHDPLSVGSWYGSSEAVTMLVGAWTLYANDRRDHAVAPTPLTGDRALRVGRVLFGGACLVYGISHFVYSAYSLPFVPMWLPARVPLLYLTGACHIAAGAGLILGILPRLAATLEAIMIILFGIMVWLPSFFAHPVPKWAGTPQNQWSETLLNFLLAATALIVSNSLRGAAFPHQKHEERFANK